MAALDTITIRGFKGIKQIDELKLNAITTLAILPPICTSSERNTRMSTV
jgi:hypothetical protein